MKSQKSYRNKRNVLLILVFLASANLVSALENGLARTPPMGWNGWNTFRCEGIIESLFKQMTDQMVTKGLKAAGYQYMNIDDCWSAGRDGAGMLKATTDFTNQSLKTLADYVHGKGLKIGIYGSAGTGTCESRSGTWDFEEKDAQRYAEWEIDFVKQDYCWTTTENWWKPAPQSVGMFRYTKFRDALLKTGRPMVYSQCSWGKIKEWEWADTVANMWRTTNDIELGFPHIKSIITQQENIWQKSKPGAWNDPDMMQVGNGMTKEQDQVHFGMWAMLAAPLIMGNDLRTMSNQTLQILTNADAIAVDQDSLGIQARVMKLHATTADGKAQVWARPLVNGRAVAFYNATKVAQTMSFTLAELNKPEWIPNFEWKAGMTGNIRDIWGAQNMGVYSGGTFTATVPPESMKFYTIRSNEINWSNFIPRGNTPIISKNRFLSAGGLKVTNFSNSSTVKISLPFESFQYTIADSQGKILASGEESTTSVNLSTSSFRNGIYHVSILKGTEKFNKSFVINR